MSNFEKCLNIEEILKDTSGICITNINIGNIIMDKENYSEALKHFNSSLSLAKHLKDLLSKERSYYFIGVCYYSLNDLEKAEVYLDSSLVCVNKKSIQNDKKDIYMYLSLVNEKKERYAQSLNYSRLYLEEVQKEIDVKTVPEVIRDYELSKEHEIIAQKDLVIKSKGTINILLIIIISLVLISIVFVYNRFKLKQKLQNEKHFSELLNLRHSVFVEAQDKERQRISEDLHGSVAIQLTSAKANMEALKCVLVASGDEDAKIYDIALKNIDSAFNQVRHISHTLMPGALKELGLVRAMKGLMENFKKQLSVNFNFSGLENRLSSKTEIGLYMVFQELLNNIIRHANASRLDVELHKHGAELNLDITDNGKGFDVALLEKSQGNGWSNIQTRLDTLKGTINIESAIEKGTKISIKIIC